jgi:WD40 repeat protein
MGGMGAKGDHAMKRFIILFVSVCMLLLPGCIPERIVWSPDGNSALVLGDDGVHLADADGKLGPVLVENAARVAWTHEGKWGPERGERASAVAWMPDGKSFLITSTLSFGTWKDFAAASGAAVDVAVLEGIRKALMTDDDAALRAIPQDALRRAALYLRDSDNEPGLTALLEDANCAMQPDELYEPVVCRRFSLADGKATNGTVIFWGAEQQTIEMRVNHTGTHVAITQATFESEGVRLFVVPADPKPGHLQVLDLGISSAYPDWEPSDKTLIYFARGEGGGTLCRQDRQAIVTRVMPRREHEEVKDSNLFELSPDGTKIAILFDEGRVAVLDVTSSFLTHMQGLSLEPFNSKGDAYTMPSWRSNSELTFVRPGKEGLEVVRSDIEAVQPHVVILSAMWGYEVKGKWLRNNEQVKPVLETQP